MTKEDAQLLLAKIRLGCKISIGRCSSNKANGYNIYVDNQFCGAYQKLDNNFFNLDAVPFVVTDLEYFDYSLAKDYLIIFLTLKINS